MKNTSEKENYIDNPMQKMNKEKKTKMILHAPQIINYKILIFFFA